jgi:hypothetical protein
MREREGEMWVNAREDQGEDCRMTGMTCFGEATRGRVTDCAVSLSRHVQISYYGSQSRGRQSLTLCLYIVRHLGGSSFDVTIQRIYVKSDLVKTQDV